MKKKKVIKIKKVLDILDMAGMFKIPKGKPGIMEAREYMQKHYKRF